MCQASGRLLDGTPKTDPGDKIPRHKAASCNRSQAPATCSCVSRALASVAEYMRADPSLEGVGYKLPLSVMV